MPDRGLSYGLLRYCGADPGPARRLADGQRAQLLFNYLGQFDQVTRGSELFAFASGIDGPVARPERAPYACGGSARASARRTNCGSNGSSARSRWPSRQHRAAGGGLHLQRCKISFVIAERPMRAAAPRRTCRSAPLVRPRSISLWQLFPGFRGRLSADTDAAAVLCDGAGRLVGRAGAVAIPDRGAVRASTAARGFRASDHSPQQFCAPASSTICTRRAGAGRGTHASCCPGASRTVGSSTQMRVGPNLQRVLDQDAKNELRSVASAADARLPAASCRRRVAASVDHSSSCASTAGLGRAFSRKLPSSTRPSRSSGRRRSSLLRDYGRYVGWLARNSPSRRRTGRTRWLGLQHRRRSPLVPSLRLRAEAKGAARPSELAVSLSREATRSLQLLARASRDHAQAPSCRLRGLCCWRIILS